MLRLIIERIYFNSYRSVSSLSQWVLLLYLVDWKAAIEIGRTITGLTWITVNGMPDVSVESISALADAFQDFYESEEAGDEALVEQEEAIVAHVVNIHQTSTDEQLIRLVRSTYPMFSGKLNEQFLVALAAEYKELIRV